MLPAEEACATPEDESCDGVPHCSQPAAWARGFGGIGADRGSSIASDAAGNYYVTGSFEGTVDFGAGPVTSAGKEDVFLLKLDPSGALIWSKRFGTSHTEIGGAVTVDGSGDVLLAGRYDDGLTGAPTGLDFGGCSMPGPLNFYGMFVVKLDHDGNHIWSTGLENESGVPTHFTVQQMAADALGNVYVAYDVNEITLVTKLDTAGNTLWTYSMIEFISREISLAVDSAGNAIVAHSALYPDEFQNGLFISKLSPSGDLL
ncbi:hypothetical protein [Sorangium sp. So ce1099]|uniref:hypothetical protein n=1 Tax=Sorangium sp. So ce1099 TaxID=3133331 RepID=UPI003F614EEB